MCYPKPGPRCSRHAHEKMERTKTKLISAGIEETKARLNMQLTSYGTVNKIKSQSFRNQIQAAVDVRKEIEQEHDQAVSEYLTTPKGIKELKESYGEDHAVVQIYQNKRDKQIKQMKEEKSWFAARKRRDKLPEYITFNVKKAVTDHVEKTHSSLLREENSKEIEERSSSTGLSVLPQKVAIKQFDMKEIKRNMNQIVNMEAGEKLYVKYDGDLDKNPGDHAYRSTISCVAESDDAKTVSIEYNPDYYARAQTDENLKRGRKMSRKPLYSAEVINKRIKQGNLTKTISLAKEGQENTGEAYTDVAELSLYKREEFDMPEAYDDLNQRQQDMKHTHSLINKLESAKKSFVVRHSSEGSQPDQETLQLFDARIAQGYTKLLEQKTMYNHANKQFGQERKIRAEHEEIEEKRKKQEQQNEEVLKTFSELKAFSFD